MGLRSAEKVSNNEMCEFGRTIRYQLNVHVAGSMCDPIDVRIPNYPSVDASTLGRVLGMPTVFWM